MENFHLSSLRFSFLECAPWRLILLQSSIFVFGNCDLKVISKQMPLFSLSLLQPPSVCFYSSPSPFLQPLLLYSKEKVAQSCATLCNSMDWNSMEFSRPDYWSGQPFPSPGNLPNPGIEPQSPALQADSLPAKTQGKPENTEVGSGVSESRG